MGKPAPLCDHPGEDPQFGNFHLDDSGN